MKYTKSWEIAGFKSLPPNERTLKVLLSPDRGGTKFASLGMSIIPPKSTSSLHTHEREEEYWFVTAGRGEAVVGQERMKIETDVAIYVPPGVPHQLINQGDETLKVLLVFSPPGVEKQFLEDMTGKY